MLGLITLLTLVSNTIAHSWIACSDYSGKNEADWDPSKCRGFPRDAARYATKDAFGLDRGFDHKPGNDGKACKTNLDLQSSYSVDYPMAVYYSGQQAVLVHPMKNHGTSAKCGNIHIPDFGNAIYNGSRWNSETSPKDSNEAYSFYKPWLVTDLGTSLVGSANLAPDTYPKPGYQNAPKFCENTDKAFASYSFNVPTHMAPGFYTFVWRWSFNGPSDIYTTCFDVEIVPDIAERNSKLQARGINDLSTICGGTLSNNEDGSDVGCNGVTAPPVLPSTDGPVVTQNPTNGPITQEPTNGPITQEPTQLPTQPPVTVIGEALAPKAYQIAGEFDLPTPQVSGVKARYATVMFQCEVEAMFWNARVIGVDNAATGKIFQLVQESEADVLSRKIYFSSMFSDSCDLLKYPPIANLVKDEK